MFVTAAAARSLQACRVLAVVLAGHVLAACSSGTSPQAPAPAAVVNVYNWSNYVDPAMLERFTAETGIEVNYDTFDSAEAMEGKLAAGRSGYDVVVASTGSFPRQVRAGVYRPLERTRLTNFGNLDPALMARLAVADPRSTYSVPYHWGTFGLAYDAGEIAARLPDAPVDGLALLFDPEVSRRLADCGIALVDSPIDVIGAALLYLGRDPNSERAEDLAAAERVLAAIRPYVRSINTENVVTQLANGEVCLALTWSGNALLARTRAREARTGADVRYVVPREGALMFFDLLAVPADAPNPDNAHRLIDFLLRADVAAELSSKLQYPNANAASWPLLDPAVRDDPTVYPTAAVQAKLVLDREDSPEFLRLVSRAWTRFRTGT